MNGPFPLKLDAIAGDFNAQRLSMYVHSKTDKHVSAQIAERGIWEPFETVLVSRFLFSGATFVDVGANIGYYSVVASSLVGPEGKVIAFEPEYDNACLLEKNISHNRLSNVQCVQAALSDAAGEGKLFINGENRGDHQVYKNAGDARQRSTQAIRFVHGSDFLAGYVDRIDVLKVDTQGAETQVMRGLLPLVNRSLPNIKIILEFTPYSLRLAGSSGMELLELVADLQLPMQLIDHIGHTLMPISFDQMAQWIRDTDADPANEGFINLLLG